MKYKIGQKVRIIKNRSVHEFEFGEIVSVRELEKNGEIDSAEKLDGSDYWFIYNDEVEPLQEEEDKQ